MIAAPLGPGALLGRSGKAVIAVKRTGETIIVGSIAYFISAAVLEGDEKIYFVPLHGQQKPWESNCCTSSGAE